MVAKIKIGKSIRGILHYNENKVVEDQASIILASGFAGDIEKLSFENKVRRFKHLTDLKPSVKTNALHISLNFEASEKIDNSKMQQVAIAYMEQIGFGDQPFLVYRHNDVAHQHIHIATTSIQRNGLAINLHNIGRERSEQARKQIEKDFNLVVAESKKYKPNAPINSLDPNIVSYGRLPTKRAMSNVINAVVDNYAFTSIAELNAVLKQFNVLADRGTEETAMFQKLGLQYSLINRDNEKIGVPIKASSFYGKPTLRNLEKKFEKNIEKRKPYKQNLTNRIDKTLNKYHTLTENTLIDELSKNGVGLIFRKNKQGLMYGATFIDNINKAVFNGSDLGKSYSAKALNARIANSDNLKTFLQPIQNVNKYLPDHQNDRGYTSQIAPTNFLNNLLADTQDDGKPIVTGFKKKRRRTVKR